jgi:hypothetical protein
VALVILRLKLAILRRGRGRGGAAQRVWFILSWAVTVVLGLAVGGSLAAAASMPGPRGDLVVVVVGSLVVLAWVLTPVLAPGLSDQVVDPARLEQYPLTRREQVGGLLLAGLVSPAAAFTLLISAGGTAAAGERWTVGVVVATLAVLTTVFCVAASRTTQTVLAGALTSRRGRELVIVLGGALASACSRSPSASLTSRAP